MTAIDVDCVCVCGLCDVCGETLLVDIRVGPLREPELDQLVEQLKNMGFDEVCLSVTVVTSCNTAVSYTLLYSM